MHIRQKIPMIWAFLCLILLSQQLTSRDNSLKFKHINEGLSQSTVQCIIQDTKGFIWIGTNNGLNRYDGTEFIIYESSVEDSTSLTDKRITTLCVDNNGDLWVGTSAGLNRYDRNRDCFIRYLADSSQQGSISDNAIRNIVQDTSGVIWISTDIGINRFEADVDTFTVYDVDKGLITSYVDAIMASKTGILWATTQGGYLHYFDTGTDCFIPHTAFNTQIAARNIQSITEIVEDAREYLWLGTSGSGLLLLKEGKQPVHYTHNENDPGSLAHNVVMSLYRDCSGMMWVGTENYGLDLFNRADESFTHFVYDPNNPYSLSSNSIQSIFEDKNGKLWVGTFHTGLNVIDPYIEKFNHYQHIPSLKNSLSNNPNSLY